MPNYRSKHIAVDVDENERERLARNGNIVRCRDNRALTELIAAARDLYAEIDDEQRLYGRELADLTRLFVALEPFESVET